MRTVYDCAVAANEAAHLKNIDAEIAQLRDEKARLARVVQTLVREHCWIDPDGDDVQEKALAEGVLMPVKVTAESLEEGGLFHNCDMEVGETGYVFADWVVQP